MAGIGVAVLVGETILVEDTAPALLTDVVGADDVAFGSELLAPATDETTSPTTSKTTQINFSISVSAPCRYCSAGFIFSDAFYMLICPK